MHSGEEIFKRLYYFYLHYDIINQLIILKYWLIYFFYDRIIISGEIMKYAIIGAGKLGCSIGIALKNKGYIPVGVYSKSEGSQKSLCDKLNIVSDNTYLGVVKDADLIFITVADSQIKSVSEQIAEMLSKDLVSEKIFFHCSGASTSDILYDIARISGIVASLHPIQTFPDRDTGWRNLSHIYFGFEGDERAKVVADKIVDVLDSRLLTINKDDKAIYHAAACILSNYTVALADTAGRLFASIGIDAKEGVDALMPLLRTTVSNIDNYGVNHSISGPISRGDIDTIKGHIMAMSEKGLNCIDVYKTVGKKMVELVCENSLIDDELKKKMNNLME